MTIKVSVNAVNLDSNIVEKKFTYIRIQPFQLLVREFVINIEKSISNRFDASIGFGYRYNDKSQGREIHGGHGTAGDYSFQNFRNQFLQAYKIDFGIKYYFREERDYFVTLNPFFRYW